MESMIRFDLAPAPAQESAVIEQLLRKNRPRLKRIFKGYNIPCQDCDDILQEALLDAIRQWETIRNLEAWLRAVLPP